MLNETTAENIRSHISDFHTLSVLAYDPQGFESLNEWALPGSVAFHGALTDVL